MKRNKILLISISLALLYIGFALTILISLGTQSNDDFGGLFAAIFSIFLIPSSIIVGIGIIFGWVAYQQNNHRLTMISLILYVIGAIVALHFGVLLIPSIGLHLVAFIQQVQSNKKDRESNLGLNP